MADTMNTQAAVQLARAIGAELFAIGSARNLAFMEQLGAIPIDYQTMTVGDHIERYSDGRGFDVIYDTEDRSAQGKVVVDIEE
jgi:NADPH:quinone reductase